MPVSLTLCIILLSALPGRGARGAVRRESLWLRVNFTVAIFYIFFSLLRVPLIGHLIIVNPKRLMD